MHTATYTTLMTIIAADVRTPIVAASIAMMVAGAAVRVSAVMSTAIYTSIMSAVDASNAPRC